MDRGASLQTAMARRAGRELDLEKIFDPRGSWFDELRAVHRGGGPGQAGHGDRLDSIWRNCFVVDGNCRFIDQEWIWARELPLNLVVARGLYYFAKSLLGSSGLNPRLRACGCRG